MTAKMAMQYADICLFLACAVVGGIMLRKRQARQFPALMAIVALRGLMAGITVALLFHRRELGLSLDFAYPAYFYSYWASSVLLIALQVLTIYSVYRIAMQPLEGLQRIGTIIFRWVAAVSLVLSSVVVLGPHVKGHFFFATLLGQMEEGVNVLTLCLLLFVCFAARPLGLTYRSRIFGITLGLGVSSCASLVISVWLSTDTARSLYSPIYLVSAVVAVASVTVWGTYFTLPEPKRKMVLLPTTSPYFLWNRISEALGDEPGMVAVAGFTPDLLAPAELAAMGSISRNSGISSTSEPGLLVRQPLILSR